MRTTEWDRVVSSAPLNKQAAVVRDGSGEQPSCGKKITQVHSRDGLPTAPVPYGTENLIGRKRGRLTVLGFYAKQVGSKNQRDKKGALWVCRCVCGAQLTRRRKSLMKDCWDACDECRQIAFIRHSENRKMFGDKRADEIRDREHAL